MMRRLIAVIGVLCVVTACETIVLGGATVGAQHFKLFQNPDINLKAKNYAATDYLVGRADTYLKQNDLITVQSFTNHDTPETPSDIGDIIPADIAERLIQLGYRTTDQKQKDSDYILSGHYRIDHPNIHVSIKMADAQSGDPRAVFDYVMPTNRDIRALSEPQPQIIRIDKSEP